MTIEMQNTAFAVFAGGCFWCTESDFEKVEGVIDAVAGYTGGHLVDPTYEQVCGGQSGHFEAVKVIYDPARVTYAQLLEVFWRSIDPTDGAGQFVDRGPQYRSAVFYASSSEKELALATRVRLVAGGVYRKPIATEILPLGRFYEAEAYHQDYHRQNPLRYKMYRAGTGRDRFLARAWQGRPLSFKAPAPREAIPAKQVWPCKGDPDVDEDCLRQRLSPRQYEVVREGATEPPFQNEFWDHHEEGLYVDVVSGEPLFSSADKFDSGSGWPSFTRPVAPDHIVEKPDHSLSMQRTEVRSHQGDSHLGHVFNDGPPPTGLRYCINSAALRFVPRTELGARGYGSYERLFE